MKHGGCASEQIPRKTPIYRGDMLQHDAQWTPFRPEVRRAICTRNLGQLKHPSAFKRSTNNSFRAKCCILRALPLDIAQDRARIAYKQLANCSFETMQLRPKSQRLCLGLQTLPTRGPPRIESYTKALCSNPHALCFSCCCSSGPRFTSPRPWSLHPCRPEIWTCL